MFLRAIKFTGRPGATAKGYPFNIPAFRNVKAIPITRPVTFFIGENGTGKSTLLEAVALSCGFHAGGGSRSHLFSYQPTESDLREYIRLSWRPKVTEGFFLRAETFYQFASYIDELAKQDPSILMYYGGRSLHEQSHGEAFFALFVHRFDRPGIYLLDEPEAALSPARQMAFLRLLWQMEQTGNAQFLLATHSPILLAYPGATIYSLDYSPLRSVAYEDTKHYRLTRDFLNDRARFLRHLLEG